MKFYNRSQELQKLYEMRSKSYESSKMTIIVGRRRIGKTRLINEAFPEKVYLFVSKKSETLLCEEFAIILQDSLNIKILGHFLRFSELFEYLMILGKERHINLVIDEFQEFYNINSSIYSEMQNIWDTYKNDSKVNLLLSGSIYSLMKKIFENAKEPLFGRADSRILLKPFDVMTLKEIFYDNASSVTNEDFLSFYMLTGGVARYVELFVNAKAFNFEAQIDFLIDENNIFLEEGKNLLIEEFGKEYTTYFSILSLISGSKTSRSEIESILEKDIGGYLDRLENEYSVIRKVKPILAKEGSKIQKYEIIDNFLNFWFRFIYKYRSALESKNFNYIKKIIIRDFSTYAGRFLEKYFKEKLALTNEFNTIGSYWERGNKNEIDIVAINDFHKKILIAEVKLNKNNYDEKKLIAKTQNLLPQFKDYDVTFQCFSLDDV